MTKGQKIHKQAWQPSKTKCGKLIGYQNLKMAEKDSEVTCKTCLRSMGR